MFIKSKNFIAKFRIDLGEELGAEKAEDAYVVLRECDTLELMELQGQDLKQIVKILKTLLPSLIVEHNIYNTETEQMNSDDVTQLVYSKFKATTKVVREYVEKMTSPFQSKTASK